MSAIGTWVYGDKAKKLQVAFLNADGTEFDTTGYSAFLELVAPGATAIAATVTGSIGAATVNGTAYLHVASFTDLAAGLEPANPGQVDDYAALVRLTAGADSTWFGIGVNGDPFAIRIRRWP